MENIELGCSGFYLYGYLKYRCDKFKEYNCSVDRLAEEVGMSRNTTDKYLSILCQEGLVSYKENKCEKIDGKYAKKANTYSVNPKGYQFGVLNNIN
jgi:predicted transcriptional regulator